jgi:hypothetical protein
MAELATETETYCEPEVAGPPELAPRTPVGAHLVGSVPLPEVEAVFVIAASALGDRLRRLPDGEPGARADWILWQ